MAHMIPEYSSAQLEQIESRAEQKIYSLFQANLPDTFLVLHSVAWLASSPGRQAQDGEIDFLIVHPDYGYLTLEVKGGGIALDPTNGQWTSTNPSGSYKIKDPYDQARRAKHQILEQIKNHRDWSRRPRDRQWITGGHAVAFPDAESGAAFVGPDRPGVITLGHRELKDPENALSSMFAFYAGERASLLGNDGVDLIERLFARPLKVQSLAIARIEEEEQARITLTQNQYRILRFLANRRQVGIQGGAGTGKTLLALAKARELAAQGMHVLLLCYNSALGDHLKNVTAEDENIEATSFHKFCESRFKSNTEVDYKAQALALDPGSGNSHLFTVVYPNALNAYLEDKDETVDAIIIDEAQDFHPDWWLPIQMMLEDGTKSPFYLFYDLNQCLFQRPEEFPVSELEEFPLDQNCRNTAAIHSIVQSFYDGDPIQPPEIPGVPVVTHASSGLEDQAESIHSIITEMIDKQAIPAEDIVVLIANRRALTRSQEALASLRLPKPNGWSQSAMRNAGKVRICSVAKFKGLEASIVFLWGLDGIEPDNQEDKMDLYVGCSRPRNELHLVGGRRILQRLTGEV